MTRTKKKIVIFYESNHNTEYDDYNHGLIGDLVRFGFRYYIMNEITPRSIVSEYDFGETSSILVPKPIYYTEYKKESLSINKINNNFNILRIEDINNRREVIIDWTEERELFLKDIQDKFIQIKGNLDNFMRNINNTNIDLLMTNNNLFLN